MDRPFAAVLVVGFVAMFAATWWFLDPARPYPSCNWARFMQVAPMTRGAAGYRPALDRDNDGIACEAYSDAGGHFTHRWRRRRRR